MPAPFRGLYARARKPGESILFVNKNVTAEQRRAREVRRRIEQLEERRRQEREREGDW